MHCPLGHRLGTDGAIELQCRLVPVKHGPLNPAAAAGLGDADNPLEQRLARPEAAGFRGDVQVLEVDTGAATPGRVVAEEKGKANWLAVKLCHKGLSYGTAAEPLAKQIPQQVGLSCFGLLRGPLILGKLADEPQDGRHIGRGCVADIDTGSRLGHDRRYAGPHGLPHLLGNER